MAPVELHLCRSWQAAAPGLSGGKRRNPVESITWFGEDGSTAKCEVARATQPKAAREYRSRPAALDEETSMQPRPGPRRRLLPPLVALGLVGLLFILSREPTLPGHEGADLASRFRFAKLPLPELSGPRYKRTPEEMVRQVHPSLRRVSAF